MYYIIPPEGFKLISHKHNKTYYYDPISNKGQWVPFNLKYTVNLPPDWIIVTKRGKVYFYNTRTKNSQYEIPENTVINPLEGVADPLRDYYIKQGIPLEDYKNTLVGLEKIGIVIPQGDITKITGGCSGKSDIGEIIDYLWEHSPNLREIDLSRCEVTPEIQQKLARFPKLQVVYSIQKLDLLCPEYPDYMDSLEEWEDFNKKYPVTNAFSPLTSAPQPWEKFFHEFSNWLNGPEPPLDSEFVEGITPFSDWIQWTHYSMYDGNFGWSATSLIKGLLATGHNPQKGLNLFIESLIRGYFWEPALFHIGLEDLPDEYHSGIVMSVDIILQLFWEYGAEPQIGRLLRPEDPQEIFDQTEPNIEDEAQCILIKTLILDSLFRHKPASVSPEKLNKYLPPDWNSILPEFYRWGGHDESSTFIQQFWANMKYYSHWLAEYKR